MIVDEPLSMMNRPDRRGRIGTFREDCGNRRSMRRGRRIYRFLYRQAWSAACPGLVAGVVGKTSRCAMGELGARRGGFRRKGDGSAIRQTAIFSQTNDCSSVIG